jgi:tRNA threonylcarbamoyladenosine biosynthesis protein TsaE
MKRSWHIGDAEQMERLGACLAPGLRAGMCVHLDGELGAGKTTLVRGMLHGLGCTQAVTSPTFTLVEPYAFPDFVVYHVDLYRVEDPSEVEALALREHSGVGVLLIEWANRARGVLPAPDAVFHIEYRDDGRYVSLETPAQAQGLGERPC